MLKSFHNFYQWIDQVFDKCRLSCTSKVKNLHGTSWINGYYQHLTWNLTWNYYHLTWHLTWKQICFFKFYLQNVLVSICHKWLRAYRYRSHPCYHCKLYSNCAAVAPHKIMNLNDMCLFWMWHILWMMCGCVFYEQCYPCDYNWRIGWFYE